MLKKINEKQRKTIPMGLTERRKHHRAAEIILLYVTYLVFALFGKGCKPKALRDVSLKISEDPPAWLSQ